MIVPVPLDSTTLDMLVRLDWLGEAELNDRTAIGAAIARLLAGVE
jgi:hypothetical protein